MDGTPYGRYRLVELLGRGGMGEVWQAFDTATERIVAIKVLPTHLVDDKSFQKRFHREARLAAGLTDPHVVPIHDFGEIDGRMYVTMRLIEGHDLQALLGHGPLEPHRAVGIIEQVASALHAAHRIGLVHRDVKPSNILVAEDDFAYLIDFGIARAAGETALTSTGATVGTWEYMAPERFQNGEADARADIYSLACVLYQALTGEPPFPSKSLEQLVTAHMMKPPPRPSELNNDIPAAMDEVIATGMAKDPDQRYPTTKDLAQAARAALATPVEQPSQLTAPDATSAETQDPSADAPTEAGPTVSASNAPTKRAPISPSSKPNLAPLVTAAPHPPVERPTSWRQSRGSKLLIGTVALGVVLGFTVVAIVLGSRGSPDKGAASPMSTTTAKWWTPSFTTSASRAVTMPPSPSPVGGWGAADALAKEFQGLLPATPDGIGYRGVRCYTASRSVWPGGVKIACGAGGRKTMGSLELEPGPVNGCYFDIEGYSPADAKQHFYDLGPVLKNGPVENWQRGDQTGTLRYGRNSSYQELAVIFDDPSRSNALLTVNCVNQQPYDNWWPNAPL